MKTVIAILAFVMLSQAHAQSGYMEPQSDVMMIPDQSQTLPPPVQKKRTVIYDERTNELVEVQPQVAEQSQTSPIYILNSQKYQGYQGTNQQTAQVQEQPLAIVEDTPLRTSPADHMRKKRQDAEASTEDGIVQALERARIEDELRRRERFNGAIGTGGVEPVVQAPVQPVFQEVVAAPVAAPQPVIEVVKEEEPKVDIKAEIRAALEEAQPKEPVAKQSYYFSGHVGMGEYPDVVNVRGDIASGFSFGVVMPNRIVAEGSFMYGKYELEDLFRSNGIYARIVDMKQYNISGGLKYQLLPGRISPNIGGLVSYARRSFEEYGYEFRTSDAVDVGVSAGLDVQLTDVMAIGVDVRYMTNMYSRENNQQRQSFVYQPTRNEIEKLDYYVGTVTGKFTF